jgi:acyl-CoA synthetase (AMP-forming)/AMP-acid ligase II
VDAGGLTGEDAHVSSAATDAVLLADLIEPWATQRPDELAISYGDRQWTWAQWHDRIRGTRAGLAAAAVGVGSRVAVLDKNHPATLEVLFAAGSLGAAVAILNWRLAAEELEFVVNDCGAEIVFAGAEFRGELDALRERTPVVRQLVVIDGDGPDSYDAFRSDADVAPASGVRPDDLLMLMYSSGTTGQPKGVMLSHRAVVAHTRNVGAAITMADDDVNLVAMPLFHVGGTCYALFGLANGVPTIMTRDPDAASLVKALYAGATQAFFVPPVIAGFLAAGQPAIDALAKLRVLSYGAAPMPLPLLQKALAAWPNVGFLQVYGQTEVSGACTVITPEEHRDPNHPEWLVSAGRPVANCEARVVDPATGDDVPPGEQGEIWLRTDQCMLGYLNRPEDTAATITSGGWLRTGDVGRVDATGHLYIEDRIKDMIITGGENVYGPEVERVLMLHPAVADAAVIGIPDERWGEAVHAVLVVREETPPEQITDFCREHLAGYKCPRSVTFVDALPRNASGKILKRELRTPYWANRDRAV